VVMERLRIDRGSVGRWYLLLQMAWVKVEQNGSGGH